MFSNATNLYVCFFICHDAIPRLDQESMPRTACWRLQFKMINPKNLEARLHLSKTLLTPSVLTTQFSNFVAIFIENACDTEFDNGEFASYVHNVLRASSLPFSVVMLSLYYIHVVRSKIKKSLGSEKITFVVSLMLGMKFICDNTYSNLSWANLSGIPLKHLNRQEMKFLQFLDYEMMISQAEYLEWIESVEKQVFHFRMQLLPDSLFASFGWPSSRRRSLTVSPYI